LEKQLNSGFFARTFFWCPDFSMSNLSKTNYAFHCWIYLNEKRDIFVGFIGVLLYLKEATLHTCIARKLWSSLDEGL
jgi:hypothetical protein